MSDFGAVWDYAVMLEAGMPEATLDKLAPMRPAVMGATRKEREEAAKAAHQPATQEASKPAVQPATPAHATAAVDDKRK